MLIKIRRLLIIPGIFILLTSFSGKLSGQKGNEISSKADSLIQVLGKYGKDTNRVKTLIALSLEYRGSDLKKSSDYANQALDLSRIIHFKKGEATALNRIGNVFQLEGNYPVELTYYLEALPIYEELNDSIGISDCYNLIGNLYTNIDNFQKALEYHQHALEIRRRLNNQRGIASSLNNIGNIYLSTKEERKALVFFEQALEINEKMKNPAWKANNLSNIGIVYDELGEFDKSIQYHNKAMEIRKELGNNLQVAGSQIYLGYTYLHKGEADKAIEYFTQGMEVADKNHTMKLLELGNHGLSEAWEKKGDMKKSLEAFKLYKIIQDSLSGKNALTKVGEAQLRFESFRKDQVEKLKQEKRDAELKAMTWAFIGGGIILFMIAGFFFYRYRIKRRSEQILEEKVLLRTQQLSQANEELSHFIYQSTHDMRSPLTSIKGLVGISLSESELVRARQYMNLVMNRVDHLDGVYTGLVNFMNVKERIPLFEMMDLNILVKEIIIQLKEKSTTGDFVFLNEVPLNSFIHYDRFLLKVIIENLLQNAVDFRETGRKGECRITFENSNQGMILKISDNGIGVPAAFVPKIFDMFSRGSNHSKGSGLGLYTAKKAAEKLQANLSLISEENTRTTFMLNYPSEK